MGLLIKNGEIITADARFHGDLWCEGETVTLRPARSSTPLRKERGVWVFRTGKAISAAVTDEVLRESRGQRDRSNRGSVR